MCEIPLLSIVVNINGCNYKAFIYSCCLCHYDHWNKWMDLAFSFPGWCLVISCYSISVFYYVLPSVCVYACEIVCLCVLVCVCGFNRFDSSRKWTFIYLFRALRAILRSEESQRSGKAKTAKFSRGLRADFVKQPRTRKSLSLIPLADVRPTKCPFHQQ